MEPVYEVLDRTSPQALPHPSHGQQALLVETLRTRTSPQAITAASTASTKRKRDPRPKLDNEKCARCRKDKVKCSPQPRSWPNKCERCSSKGFECSPGEIKRRARRKISPTSLNSPGPEPTRHDHQASAIRNQIGQESAEPHDEDVQKSWDHADLTNIVTFVQLLNHERSLLDEASSYFEKLNLEVDFEVFTPYESQVLYILQLELVEDVRLVLRYVSRSESFTMTDQILYENAHEAIGEDFAVPRHDPISEEALAKLPIGVQIRHLIRKLRLDIQHRGSCDFKPLYRLLSQLEHERSGWAARFGFYADYDRHCSGIHISSAYSLVVSQFLTEPLIRIWVRDYILRSGNDLSHFPITRFAELWNADIESVILLTLDSGHAGDSEKLPLLHVAVLSNKPRIVRALIKDSLNTTSHFIFAGLSSFHLAASVGSVDCYRALLRCDGADLVEGEGADNGDLPLHIAARNGHAHLVDYILDVHFDDETYVNNKNWEYETPLMLAARHGKYDVVQFLLDYPGVDLTVCDQDLRTALDHANKNEKVFCLILSRLPDQYFNTGDEEGETPLHWLAKHAGPKPLGLVLSLPSILPDQEDEYGRTPLCRAVHAGNLEAVKALGIRRDVDTTKLSTCELWDKTTYIDEAKRRASKNNNYSQVLDWLKIHCKELEADLADWEITTEDAAQGTRNSERNAQEE